jgi:hypothetical protein
MLATEMSTFRSEDGSMSLVHMQIEHAHVNTSWTFVSLVLVCIYSIYFGCCLFLVRVDAVSQLGLSCGIPNTMLKEYPACVMYKNVFFHIGYKSTAEWPRYGAIDLTRSFASGQSSGVFCVRFSHCFD